MELRFAVGPGHLYDLVCLFALHYSRETWQTDFAMPGKVEEDLAELEIIFSNFSAFPNELQIFFHLKDSAMCFFTNHFFNRNEVHRFHFQTLLDLLETDEVVEKSLFYYFCNEKQLPGRKEKTFVRDVTRLLRDYGYTGSLRYHLLRFYINPQSYISLLKQELKKKYTELKRFYKKNAYRILTARKQFSIAHAVELQTICFHQVLNEAYLNHTFEITFCLINKYILLCMDYNYFLGWDYRSSFQQYHESRNKFDYVKFGRAVKDRFRLDFIECVRLHKEITQNEIVQMLHCPKEVIYFHVNLLVNGCLIESKYTVDGVVYYLNVEWIEFVSKIFYDYFEDAHPKECLT